MGQIHCKKAVINSTDNQQENTREGSDVNNVKESTSEKPKGNLFQRIGMK